VVDDLQMGKNLWRGSCRLVFLKSSEITCLNLADTERSMELKNFVHVGM
jgi:hypothetical protein